jgi:hypothetical protein
MNDLILYATKRRKQPDPAAGTRADCLGPGWTRGWSKLPIYWGSNLLKVSLKGSAPLLSFLVACVGSPPARDPAAIVNPSRAASVTSCALALPAPVTISVEEPAKDELHLLFDLEDTDELWRTGPDDETARKLKAAGEARLGAGGVNAAALLDRQAARMGHLPMDAANNALIRSGVGKIDAPSCLARALLKFQDRRFDLLTHPTEFGAFILRGQGRARVYLSSLDRVGVKLRPEVVARVTADRRQGYRVTAHLHNHTFLVDRKVGDRMWTTAETLDDIGGGIAPSTADAQFFQGMAQDVGLENAWITNGIESLQLSAGDFTKLKLAPAR